MINLRTALVLVLPVACATLVACRASVGEEVGITGESEEVSAADTAHAQAAPPSPKPSAPTPVASPAPSSNEPGGGAASETAPLQDTTSPDASPSDAGVDAPADVAPKPSYSCTAPAMSSYATESPCSKSPIFTPGGDLKPGTYFLSQWWSSSTKICGDTLDYSYNRSGTMIIEVIDGITYMRWTLSGTTSGSGTARLTSIDSTSLTRYELCGLSKGNSTAVEYWTSETDLVLKRKDGIYEERWTKVPTKTWVPRDPIDIKL